jgi:putative intracellular protease/amidase
VYVAAYYTGSAVLGETPDEKAAAVLAAGGGGSDSLLDKAAEFGKPWAVGLLVFAVCGAALAWVVVNLGWIAAVRWRRWRGKRVAPRATRLSVDPSPPTRGGERLLSCRPAPLALTAPGRPP